jgi:general stress protein YciG
MFILNLEACHMDIEKQRPKPKRGFAAMSAERLRQIASKGGKAVPNDRRSFSQDRELAASAGRTGGINSQARRPN